VDIGVAGTLDKSTGGGVELVALERISRRLHQRYQGQEDREVDLDGGEDPRRGALRPDPTVQIVEHHGDHQDDHQHHQGPVHHELEERELEDEEPDVQAELRILDTEGYAVGEQDPVVPLPHGP
jgi:hypothetical protein